VAAASLALVAAADAEPDAAVAELDALVALVAAADAEAAALVVLPKIESI
jgi:hypothetical protein